MLLVVFSFWFFNAFRFRLWIHRKSPSPGSGSSGPAHEEGFAHCDLRFATKPGTDKQLAAVTSIGVELEDGILRRRREAESRLETACLRHLRRLQGESCRNRLGRHCSALTNFTHKGDSHIGCAAD